MDPNKIYQSFIESGYAMAEAQFLYQQLDDQTKSLLASLVLAARDVEGVKSMAEAREVGLASIQYRDHLRDVAQTRLVFTKAKVKYEAVKALFEAQRTTEATHRAANRAAP